MAPHTSKGRTGPNQGRVMSKKLDILRPFRAVTRIGNRNSAPENPPAGLPGPARADAEMRGPSSDILPDNLRRLPGRAEGPGVSELAGDELEDVLSAVFDTGEERDPDSFDDTLFTRANDPAGSIRWRHRTRIRVQPVGSSSQRGLDALLSDSRSGDRTAGLSSELPEDDLFADLEDILTDTMLGDREDQISFSTPDILPAESRLLLRTVLGDPDESAETLPASAASRRDRDLLDDLLALPATPAIAGPERAPDPAAPDPHDNPLDALFGLPPGPATEPLPGPSGRRAPVARGADKTVSGPEDEPATARAATARPDPHFNVPAMVSRAPLRSVSEDELLRSLIGTLPAEAGSEPERLPDIAATQAGETPLGALLALSAAPAIIQPQGDADLPLSRPEAGRFDALFSLPVVPGTSPPPEAPSGSGLVAAATVESSSPGIPAAAESLGASAPAALSPPATPLDLGAEAGRVTLDHADSAPTPAGRPLPETRGDEDLIDWAADLISDDEDVPELRPELRPDSGGGQTGRRVRRPAQDRGTTDRDSRIDTLLAADAGPDPRTIDDVLDEDVLTDLLREDNDDLFLSPEDDEPPSQRPAADPATSPARRRSAGMDDLDRVLQMGAAKPTTASKWRTRLIWAAILGGLTWLAFQPYAFEVGGDFIIQPIDRAEARARTDGEITVINVAQGDWVEKDQILAVISNWDEERDVILNETDNARLRADLATLTRGASPEQINVAEEALRSAEVQVEITARNLARQETLFASGTIPEKEMLASRDQHDLAIAARNQAQAGLDLVNADASQTEVDAQLAAIARNDEELAFARLMLEYTNIRAPAAGQIVSSMTEVPVGAYLSTGSLFAEIENNRTVIAEIDLPEITVEEVALGATAELRLWSEPERSLFGTVQAIAPRAEESEFGPVIRVQVEVPNPDGDLSANMSGFGKISAGDRPAWQVFSRAVYRFFSIEVWSWLP
jgi:multidrug efflux pump subunit AcrA (membrane-fusion protein)